MTKGSTAFAASMNASSLSTLRTLRLQHDIEDDIQDPLCGICEEFSIISGRNVIEEIFLDVVLQTDSRCKTGSEWERLDAVLSRGFPKLRTVSLNIEISASAPLFPATALKEQVNKILSKYLPWLASNIQVTFKFSTSLHRIRMFCCKYNPVFFFPPPLSQNTLCDFQKPKIYCRNQRCSGKEASRRSELALSVTC
ncbi:uncharacterized protein LACBIDRAFT_307001 [Laccaria bicolor S238N-H82]|uniref:Predicted protein n=1 Tax=Laccaria bicolor (strain S238N-H82 / ATCC MYA-4686) TaxID=486041 RepID=B0DP53_LACBS|nr:uncharacterized protein LACBIDRAFT_307001 [Laccaria bicolor S238N-H82]EDR03554.1 predicted protein [Laccaria bicolor S238N-H82]|eukprot:XP_001885702.1 predicted protein [Laccaria bicolor S238N-H82]